MCHRSKLWGRPEGKGLNLSAKKGPGGDREPRARVGTVLSSVRDGQVSAKYRALYGTWTRVFRVHVHYIIIEHFCFDPKHSCLILSRHLPSSTNFKSKHFFREKKNFYFIFILPFAFC